MSASAAGSPTLTSNARSSGCRTTNQNDAAHDRGPGRIEMDAKTFVVPLDGSAYAERALPIAETLAERVGGGLLLVSAQYDGPREPRAYLEQRATLCRRR